MKAVVINLDHRTDRIESARHQLASIGIVDSDRFSAFSKPDPLRGNGRSHHKCLSLGYDLIFEDDVFFINGAKDILDKAISQLPEDWDLLYLGGNVEEPLTRFSDNLFECHGTWGSFAIMYSSFGVRKVLKHYDPYREPFEIYDVFLRHNKHHNLNAFIVSPFIAWTFAGFSDVNGQEENYLPKMQENERMFAR